ncbi:cell envelope integrity protein TolA [Mucilaginibacter terrigena]|uniref:cell envelope integrity protein TolA n=1 Tax=Mucilaginibacter terrigena TaxID=2492395 RepID=UPI001396835A|nr:cell envelope integrity protein TolA [Mucilaginibacter terrigena]
MKILNKIWGIGLLAFMLMLAAPHKTIAQQEGQYISDQEFYDELQPYGTWVEDPQYGTVWVPDVEEDFRPYATRGHWALTEYGNTWVSDYPWGWATFHYGRWHFDDYYGWEWIPGNEWAPAWVTWRDGGGYYGWAPMEPGVSFDASYADNYSVPDNYWIFAPYAYINYTNVYNYYVPHTRVNYIIRNTHWMRNRYTRNNHNYNAGPRREDIQRYSHRPVHVYNITNVNRPSRITVNKNTINIYRPAVRQNTDARPARVVDGAAYKQQNPAHRIAGSNRSKGTIYNAANAAKLAQAARDSKPDSKLVRVNTNVDGRANANPATRPARPDAATRNNDNKPDRTNRPAVTGDVQHQRDIDKQQSVAQRQQMREQQQKAREQQTEQQKQATEQRAQQQEAHRQQRATRPAVTDNTAETQQKEQARQQVLEQKKQQLQERQQVREQQEQQRQQAQQAREQQKQQQTQQLQERQQAREQQEQQRQQAQQAREQQKQQKQQQTQQLQERQQAREQQEQQRQQAQQAREQHRQQQEQQQQAREQQRQQQEQQRQQQQQAREQQRQQQEQQRQQQSPAAGHRPRS